MDHDPQTQSTTRLWALTIERFTEVAWSRHGATRYASVLALPILVAMFVPGWWWAGCALCAVAGMALDLYTHARFDRPLDTLKLTGADELKRDANRRVAAISLITSLYSAPYALLAFAPAPASPRPS